MKRIKIGFIGPQGSGKTTKAFELATELKKCGLDVILLSEVARSCPFEINEGADKETQLWLLGKQLTREQSMKGQVLITDRTLLDNLVYALRCNQDFFESLKSFVREYVNTYDLIFYMPGRDDYLKDDGIRSVDKEFRDEIEYRLQELMALLDVQYVQVDDVVGYTLTYMENLNG